MAKTSLQEIIDRERDLATHALERHGKGFENAAAFVALIQNSLDEASPHSAVAMAFYSQVRKYSVLSLLAAVRLHRVQAAMCMRQMLEATALCAYALGNPEPGIYERFTKGNGNWKKFVSNKVYIWLENEFPSGNDAVFKWKEAVNKNAAHCNIINAFLNIDFGEFGDKYNFEHFDPADSYWISADLYAIGNACKVSIDLLNGVNKKYKHLKFKDGFEAELLKLEKEESEVKKEVVASERYQAALKKAAIEPVS